MDKVNKLSAFVVPLLSVDLNIDNNAILAFCKQQSKLKGRVETNVGGWQSKNIQTNNVVYNELLSKITSYANEMANDIGLIDGLRIDISWININGYKDYNLVHKHPHSTLSGVYYVSVPKDSGRIVFENPACETMMYDWHLDRIKDLTVHTSSKWFYETLVGRLYVFPGWLNHSVEPNLNKKEKRISISFNLS
jgi:uncharacterized protein (TIGR02466 family)